MHGSSAKRHALPRPVELGFRVLTATALVLVSMHAVERVVVNCFLPVFRQEIPLLSGKFSVVSAEIARDDPNGNEQLRFLASVSRPILLEGKMLLPSGWQGIVPQTAFELKFTLDDALEYAAILLIVVLAWPGGSVKEFLLRLALSVPLMILLVLIAVPTAVIAELWNQVRHQIDAHGFSTWVVLRESLGNGGGLVLGCFMAGLAIGTAKSLVTSPRKRITREAEFRIYAINQIPKQ